MGKSQSKFAKDLLPVTPEIVRNVMHNKRKSSVVDSTMPRKFENALHYYTEMINESLYRGFVEGAIMPKQSKESTDYYRATHADLYILKRTFANRGFLDVNIYNDTTLDGQCVVYQVTLPRPRTALMMQSIRTVDYILSSKSSPRLQRFTY